jgi:hypothetical protein
MLSLILATTLSSAPASARTSAPELTSSLRSFPVAGTSPTSVSCTDPGVCVAVDYFGHVDVLSGNKAAQVASTGYYLDAVSCSSVAFCMAMGEGTAIEFLPTITRTFALGRNTSAGPVDWTSVSCPAPGYCMAGGSVDAGQGARIPVDATWNGLIWSAVKTIAPPRTGPGAGVIASLSCAGSRFCVAAGSNEDLLQWNGNRWSYPRQLNVPDDGDSFVVSCVSASFCMAVGNSDSAVSIWNGHTWRARTSPALPGGGGEVSCDTPTFCVATDAGMVSAWNGRTWSPVRSLDAGQFLNGISCAAGFCEGIEEKGRYAYLDDPQSPPRLPVFCARLECPGTRT